MTEMRDAERSPLKGVPKYFRIDNKIHTGFAVFIMDVIASLNPEWDMIEVGTFTIDFLTMGKGLKT